MPKSRIPYPPEFRQQMIELVRSGRSPGSLAKEFEPSAQTIQTWVKQADLDSGRSGRRHDGLTTSERAEIRTPASPDQAVAHRARHPGKSSGLVRSGDRFDAHRAFEFVKAYQALYPVTTLCRVLGVSTSGYYAWRVRHPSARRQADARLQAHIEAIHAWSDGTYGTPRILAQLRQEGVHVGAKRVARLLRQAGLQGVSRRPWVTTTRRAKDRRPAPDLVDRDFSADGPDRLWVADITYVATWAGFHLPGRRPGCLQSAHHRLGYGRPFRCRVGAGCPQYGPGSASTAGRDSSFRSRLPIHLHRPFPFFEGWYNPHRSHSAIDYLSPISYEMRWKERPEISGAKLSTKPG